MSYDPEDVVTVRRRRFLAGAAGNAALLGGVGAVARGQGSAAAVPNVLPPQADLAVLRSSKSRRASSFDRSGANADFVRIAPGQTHTLLEAQGPGIITHIWFTINSRDEFHLKNLVLRAYWDGESEPSVEVPVGDFFGLNLGNYFLYQSALTSVASIKALNAYFPMPFSQSARLTVTNDGARPADSFYFNIDYMMVPQVGPELGRFHAQYRQQTPTVGWTNDWGGNGDQAVNNKPNLYGESNYVFMEAKGRGHLIGVTQGVLQNQSGWWGEGDEMAIVDGEKTPLITGTGTEDYYNGAWNFGGIDGAQPFAYWHNGAPYIVDAERVGGRYCLYRWHLENPVTFDQSLRFTIEHGHANHRSDSFFSTAYWYQTEPHTAFPPLPKAQDRVPRVVAVSGPGPMAMPKNAGS
jgi:hypothetical protein